ncbi:MAG: metal ABC transporter substrate-binding protein [Verrucomicrobiota bacterium]
MKFQAALVGITLAAVGLAAAEKIKVASLHPLLGHLSREIGGENIETIDLIGPDGDPHRFNPHTSDLRRAEGAVLYLASGMGLETYLGRLRTILGDGVKIVEVGATLPAMEGACDHDHDHSAHEHTHEIDPHWWHSIDLYRRSVTIVAEEFSRADPPHADAFRKRAEQCRSRLDELERWARREIAKVPREKRHLATAHAAFHYFCKDFGFTAHPVQGLNREQVPSAENLAEIVRDLRAAKVAAIFPEKGSNPKILQTLTNDTGIVLGPPLIADGANASSYDEMMRSNIRAIVSTLAGK